MQFINNLWTAVQIKSIGEFDCPDDYYFMEIGEEMILYLDIWTCTNNVKWVKASEYLMIVLNNSDHCFTNWIF